MKFVKMTSDDNGEWGGEYTVDMLPEKARESMTGYLVDIEMTALKGAINCESPIEQIMGVQMHLLYDNGGSVIEGFGYELLEIENQREFCVNGKKYRVDFAMFITDVNNHDNTFLFIIECDGHDFHEKTKEQAAHDKARDRDLSEIADLVLHYTGSEIYNERAIIDLSKRIQNFVIKQWKKVRCK
jgi:very-short-patch-repair endonuclease